MSGESSSDPQEEITLQIIVADPTGANELGGFEDFIYDLRRELASISEKVEIRSTDIGRGADWPVVLAAFGGLFFLGKRIEENLDAWTSLARRFLDLLKRISQKFGSFRLDGRGATLLAIESILRKVPNLKSIEQTFRQEIPISPFPDRPPRDLDQKPDTMYIQCFRVNDDTYYIFAIKSTGSIEIEYAFEDDWGTFSGLGHRA